MKHLNTAISTILLVIVTLLAVRLWEPILNFVFEA